MSEGEALLYTTWAGRAPLPRVGAVGPMVHPEHPSVGYWRITRLEPLAFRPFVAVYAVPAGCGARLLPEAARETP